MRFIAFHAKVALPQRLNPPTRTRVRNRCPACRSGPLRPQIGEIMSMTSMKLTALFVKVPEGYVAFIEELPGANTQGATLDEARENLREAVALVLDANRAMSEQSL